MPNSQPQLINFKTYNMHSLLELVQAEGQTIK